jgi:hypothetical protein
MRHAARYAKLRSNVQVACLLCAGQFASRRLNAHAALRPSGIMLNMHCLLVDRSRSNPVQPVHAPIEDS